MHYPQSPHPHHAIRLRSEEKALQRSRRLVQSAKIRVRRPLHPEFFERPAPKIRMAQPMNLLDFGKIDPSDGEAVPVSFPETLERPELPPVQLERIAQFEPELAGVPAEYARDALVYMGMRYVQHRCSFIDQAAHSNRNQVDGCQSEMSTSLSKACARPKRVQPSSYGCWAVVFAYACTRHPSAVHSIHGSSAS